MRREKRMTRREAASRRAVRTPVTASDQAASYRAAFKEKFGREPGPDDPVIFDPTAAEPRPYMPSDYALLGINPAKAYAIKKTGCFIVDGVNDHQFTAEQKQAFFDSFLEYNAKRSQ